MDYVEARTLVRLRQELREHLRGEHVAKAGESLARLAEMADLDPALRGEYERWRVRFALLSNAPPIAA